MALKELEAKDLARLDPRSLGAISSESRNNNEFVETPQEVNSLMRDFEASSADNVRKLLAGPVAPKYPKEESKSSWIDPESTIMIDTSGNLKEEVPPMDLMSDLDQMMYAGTPTTATSSSL